MNKKYSFRICFGIIIPFFLLTGVCSRHYSSGPATVFPAFSDSIPLESSVIIISKNLMAVYGDDDTVSLRRFYRVLDNAATVLAQSLGDKKKSPAAADSIIALVYDSWKIGFDPADTIPGTLLPHLVFKNKKGACLGVSLVMLMLAERIGCPMYGVMLPGHFFCRYDDGIKRFNIEPNKSGFSHPDGYYRERYPVAGKPWYDLSSLVKSKTIGMLCYNAGTLCMNRGRHGVAILYFREAAARISGFGEATGNLALAYAAAGKPDSSLAVFETLFAAHPDFANLAANYGGVAMAAKQYDKAVEVFKKGLEYFPEDTVLLSGLSRATAKKELQNENKIP